MSVCGHVAPANEAWINTVLSGRGLVDSFKLCGGACKVIKTSEQSGGGLLFVNGPSKNGVL